MKSIVAIGEQAFYFADSLSSYPEYNIYSFANTKAEFKLPVFTQAERYEEPIDGLKEYLATSSNEIICVVSGGEPVSLSTLVILEELKEKDIEVVYLMPNKQLLNEGKTRINNLVYGVLQEMTRSGVFKRFYLFELELVRKIMTKTALSEIQKSIAENCARHYHTYKWLASQEAVFSLEEEPSEKCVISSISYCDFDLTTESELGMIRFTREQEVLYGLSENKIKEDTELYDKVMKSFTDFKKEDVKSSFKVFPVPYEEDIIYVRNSTSAPQNKLLEEALDKANKVK